jgi:predicted dehydrogenase
MSTVGTAVVGASGWGKNVVRAFFLASGSSLRWVCDLNPALLSGIGERFPGIRTTRSFDQVLADPAVRAVAVAVDSPNHFAVARAALEGGRHVFVEKPLALTTADAGVLCTLAERAGLTLMVGHLLLYHPAIELIRSLIDVGDLGEVLYACTERVNLGIVRDGEDAWWSLAAHDVAVAIHLFRATPISVSATGGAYLRRGIADVAFATLGFADGRTAHLHVSWLNPHKRRALTVVGSKKMLTFDDTAADEKIKIYDKGAVPRPGHTTFAEGVAVRVGDVVSPFVSNREPLLAECEHFMACVASGGRPRSDGRQGQAVVRVLEAGEASIRAGGVPIVVAGAEGQEAGTAAHRGGDRAVPGEDGGGGGASAR